MIFITTDNNQYLADGVTPNPDFGNTTVRRQICEVQYLRDGTTPNQNYDPNPPNNSISLAAWNAILSAASDVILTAIQNWPTG